MDGEQQHLLELALASLDDAVPVLTAHPLTTAGSIVQAIAQGEALEKLTDDELLRKTAREVAIAVYVVAHAMIYKAEEMATKPAEAGFLAQALAKCFAAATGPLSAQHGQLMTHGNQLKFKRGAAAKTEGEDRNKGEENRYLT